MKNYKLKWENPPIDALNQMIEKCIEHGGDAGGAYCSCYDDCVVAIKEFLEVMGINNVKIVNVQGYPEVRSE